MVEQVRPDAGQVRNHLDTKVLQMIRRPDPREHQQLRGADGAGREHYLPRTFGDECLGAHVILHRSTPVAVHQHPMDQRVGDHIQAWPAQDRGEIGVRRALAPAVNDIQVAPTEALFHAAADVPRPRVTGLPGCLQASLCDGMPPDSGSRPERAPNTAQRGIATFGMFAALEGRQQVVEPPALRTRRDPGVVAGSMPAHEVHRVDR